MSLSGPLPVGAERSILRSMADESDESRRPRIEALKKFLASLADGDDAMAKFGKAVAIASSNKEPDAKEVGLMVFADALAPGVSDSWKRLIAAVQAFASDGFKGLLAGDPVLVPAARIIQAVLVAVEKRDEDALHEWELKTFAYMEDHALDDYAVLPIPPRTGHDRHVVLGALLKHTQAALGALPPMCGMMETAMFSMIVSTLVQSAFPQLQAASDGPNVADVVGERLPQYIEKYGQAKDIDAEVILTDVFEVLGVPRKTFQQTWLKGVKP